MNPSPPPNIFLKYTATKIILLFRLQCNPCWIFLKSKKYHWVIYVVRYLVVESLLNNYQMKICLMFPNCLEGP